MQTRECIVFEVENKTDYKIKVVPHLLLCPVFGHIGLKIVSS